MASDASLTATFAIGNARELSSGQPALTELFQQNLADLGAEAP